MRTAEFLKELLSQGIRLRLDGDRLVSEAPPGALTPERAAEIRSRKEELIAFLAKGHRAETLSASSTSSIGVVSREGRLPLSFAQQRLWFLNQIEEGSNLYNIPMTLGLKGPLDRDALRRSIEAIVSRHEVLRTTFPDVDGVPYQSIAPDPTRAIASDTELSAPVDPVSQTWEWRERDLDEVGGEEALAELLKAEAWRPFDLAKGPLFRVGLYQRGAEDHVLQVVMYHGISDGWSFGVFRRELSTLYTAFLAGELSPLEPLPIQYADFSAWQQNWLQGETLEEQMGYWRQKLEDLTPLELPTDRPRPPALSYKGAAHGLRLSSRLAEELRALSREEGTTLFMTLMAAFHVLLHRYSGQSDIAVGTPIAGRNRTEIEGLIGMFVNTLVIRSDMAEDPSFRSLLGQVRETSLEAHAYQDLPFEKLVEELQPERDLSRNPLFQVMLAWQNPPEEGSYLPGVEARTLSMGGALEEFDLSLSIWEETESEAIGVLWSYPTDLFDAGTIQRMGEHFERLLEGIVADPDARVGELELVPEAERRQLMVWGTGPELAVPEGVCIHDLFEARVAEAPGRVALVAKDGSLTYGELEARANRLARHLVELGVAAETLVGVSLPRTTEMVVAVLGILKAGGAYLPLDPDLPEERLAFMLEDGGAPVLVTKSDVLESLPPFSGDVVFLDRDSEKLRALSDARPGVSVDPRHLAYVIYTSGSTGKPKGVEVCHQNVSGYLSGIRERPGMSADDVLLAVGSLSFDFSVEEIFGSLSVGARIVLASADAVSDGDALRALLEESGVNLISCTPTTLRMLFSAGWQGNRSLRAWTGAEELPQDLARETVSRCGELWNLYGPTETTVTTTGWQVPEGFEHMRIGSPLPNYQVYVLDGGMQLLPVGVPGEIFVGGVGVARGYLNRPEFTAERFVPDPFRGEPGARLYRTGDLGRFHEDGTLEFLGRLDNQVKIRGLRIELGEIEAVLSEHEAVRHTAVLVYGEGIDARLVAYVVFEEGGEFDLREMRRILRQFLPDYMVPSLLVELDELPLTSSGKLDRKKLPKPDEAGLPATEAFVAPRTPTEEALAGIWAEVLKTDRVGVHDDFFALGGHSLLATQVMSRVTRDLGVELPLRNLFEASTVAELAERIEALTPHSSELALPIERANRKERLPLSFAQQRLWFLDRIGEGSNLYIMPMTLELTGPLDRDALRRSLEAIVARHEVLRTAFPDVDGVPYQAITPDATPLTWEWAEKDLDEVGGEEALAELLRAEAWRPFDLANGPLFRAGLYRRSDEDHVLQVVMYHGVSDGWSVGVFGRELSALYTAFLAGEPSPLEPLPIQYADFSAWQQEWLQGEILEEQMGYWREQLDDLTPLDLPTDRPRPAVPSFEGRTHGLRLSSALTEGLRALSRNEGTTLFMTLMAAFHVLLHRYSGQSDIAVGTPIAGRNRSEIEGLIGMFVNTLVIRSDMAEEPSFRTLLGQVREASLEAHAHQDLPFEKLVEELQPERDLSRNPLFQVMFALENASEAELAMPGLEVRPRGVAGGATGFDLNLFLWEETEGGAIGVSWTYATDLFDAGTIQRMGEHFEKLLEGIVADPHARVGELDLVPEAERRQLEAWGTGPELAVPEGLCTPELFEARVAEAPNRMAVEAGDGSLTYGELEVRANRLARHLVELGVGAETLVGVSLPRTTEMVVGVLGILKAGGAYLPLDPDLPEERLAYMLEDGDASVVVSVEDLETSIPPFPGTVVCLDRDADVLEGLSGEPLRATTDPGQLAYVMYTSGSTGQPKGVEVTHANLVTFLFSLRERPGFSAEDVLLASTTLAFDFSVVEIFGLLSAGAGVVLAPKEAAGDGAKIQALLGSSGVNAFTSTPSAWRMLLDAGWQGDGSLRAFVGGEALPLDLARDLVSNCGEVWNLYGPTEGTVAATGWQVPTDVNQIRIGTPLANYRVYVLDERMQPVPVGVPGELYIGGAGVTRGYRNQSELTAEQFVADPFGSGPDVEPGGRLYRTGDRVRFRDDGTLEFLGRLDNQVKIRGLRIELGEIEARLAEHEAVRQTAVLVDGEGADARLVAYVVLEEGEPFELKEMRAFLRRFLPDYMVPSLLIELNLFPLTPGGKLDLKALPSPEAAGLVAETAYVAPRTPTEEALAGIWAEVLGLEQVSVHDDFFALGGHSLLATQVISRVTRDLKVEFPLRTLFEASTVAELAERIEALNTGASGAPPPIAVVSRKDRIPLSFAQQRLWFLDWVGEGSNLYNMPMTLGLTGPLDPDVLRRSIEAIVARHEVLRTTFPDVDGVPFQAIAPDPTRAVVPDTASFAALGTAPSSAAEPTPPAWEWTERDLADVGGEEALADLLKAEARRPFNLARGPLFRVGLYRRSDEDHVLQLVMHHGVSDGWSLGVFRQELSALYSAFLAGEPSPLEPLPIQYADYSAWQQEWLQGEVLEEQLGYWRRQLEDLTALDLPTDRPRPGILSYESGMHRLRLSSTLVKGLRALSRAEGTTLFMTLMAAFHVLLHRYSNQLDIAVGTPIAGRNRSEIEGLMGMFVNTLVIRSDMTGNPSFRGLLGQVRETSLEAHAHQDLPFEKLVEELQPERDLSRNPLFQVMFMFQNAPEAELAMQDLDLRSLGVGDATSEFDLTLTLWEEDDEENGGNEGAIGGSWTYARDLFDTGTIQRMGEHFEKLLEAIVADPSCRVTEAAILDEGERRQLEAWGTGPEVEIPEGACIHDLFVARVAEAPDRVAVEAEDGSLTYGELDSKANQLARYLVELGVGDETLVGVSLPRTTEMVVAVLGILKAGGAYLPLDPDLPVERVAYMLQDGGALLVLTTVDQAEAFSSFSGRVVCVDGNDGDAIGERSGVRMDVEVNPHQLAYVIYTSGSTGQPKGVEVCHKSVVNFLLSLTECPGLSADDVMLAVTTLTFDISVLELFGPLTVGGRVVVAPSDVTFSGQDLLEQLSTCGSTVMQATPATWHMLFDAGWKGDKGLRIWTGGEALPLDLARRLTAECNEVWNLYGPTETTVWSCRWRTPEETGQILIGQPIGNTSVYVLDDEMQPVPAGVPGELYIGGAGVARGYRNRPELTAERFVSDPFSGEAGARMYRTGDRVRFRDDGTLEFLERLDNQVKIRGFRIELGEIEARLAEHEAVRQAVVLVDGESVDSRLVAYLLFKGGQILTSTEVRSFLRQYLPDYMVPSAIVEIDAFPLTSSGKLDRKALPHLRSWDRGPIGAYHPPETENEVLIAEIWQDLLGLERISRTDNFYEIGGHSLLSIQAVARLRKKTGKTLDPRAMFFQTLAQLAETLE